MLRLEQVRKSFAEPDGTRLPILDVPRFEVAAGEQMVLVGHSGSGKSTLLQVIAGISRADAGEVWVADTNICRLSEPQRDAFRARHIGFVFQTFNLLPGFTALENVLLGMTFTGSRSDPARARQLLERVGLSARLAHKPAMLSVGEQQRVAVARALANRPQLLLADEPTASVDARNQQQIVDLLRATCEEEQVALVVVTHDTGVASQFTRVDHLEQLNRVTAVA